jgi:hypothetical protein
LISSFLGWRRAFSAAFTQRPNPTAFSRRGRWVTNLESKEQRLYSCLGVYVTFTLAQALTLSIAVIGAVLGIINTWQNLDKSRLKLKVTPTHAIPIGDVDPRLTFCIEVANLSAFPVSIRDAGVFYRGTQRRGSIIQPVFSDGGMWPKRLEPRSSVTVYRQTPEPFQGHKIRCAYATTQCGYTKVGTSPALRQIARMLN